MVPKIHKKGTGFGGITQYVLHDKGADTSERVEWTETVNLGTRNPHTASRVMMATSMDQDRLKREAGVKTTGRKSKAHVLHVTLSWHADESEELTRDDQILAAKWFMKEIKADQHQALIVAHNDEPQAHVHLVINRVSPIDGRILSSSLDRINASRWAEKYERERGEILCHQRAINNAARARGEYVKGEKDLPRPIVEKMAAVANDNATKEALIREQRKKSAAIAKEQRAVRERHRQEWLAMERQTKEARDALRERIRLEAIKERQTIRDGFRQRWEEHHHEQQAGQAYFDINERTLRGRIENAKKLVEWKNLLGKKSEGERVSSIAHAFKVFASEGARREALARQHRQEEARVSREQRSAEKQAVDRVKSQLPDEQDRQAKQYEAERQAMITKHRLEAAKVKARWRSLEQQREQEWQILKKQTPSSTPDTRQKPTAEKPSHSIKDRDDAAKRIDDEKRRAFRERLRQADRDREKDRGDRDR